MGRASVVSEASAEELKDVIADSVLKETFALLQGFEVVVIDVAADVILSNERVMSCLRGNGFFSSGGTGKPCFSSSFLGDLVTGLMWLTI